MSEAAAALGFSSLLSDERLTRRAVGGDDRAFAAIFRRYHQSLYRFCLSIVGNPEDAQDALQNTMMKVLRALPGEEREIELKPWLYRIAHNESIDLLRRRRETRELDAEHAAPGYGLAEDAATRERLRRLIADVRELPERQREVLVMRELSGLDFDEIGAALETSAAVARQTLYEARKSLHQMEEGREMSCEAVTQALSDGDGRVTRRRDVRAHLRACPGCRGFGDDIKRREQDFAALSPLPAVAAAGMLQGLLGGSQAAGGAAGGGLAATLGGGAAKTIATSAAVKGVATVAVVAAVGVTAADRSGVIHLGLPGEESSKSAPTTPGSGGTVEHGDTVGGAATGAAVGHRSRSAGKPAGGAVEKGTPGSPAASDVAPGQQHAQAHHPVAAHGGSQEHGPPAETGSGAAEEKGHPEGAAGGQETATEHKPSREAETEPVDEGGEAASPEKPSAPKNPATPPPPKEAPENPPKGAGPGASPHPQPPAAKTEGSEPVLPAPAGEHGKGLGKNP